MHTDILSHSLQRDKVWFILNSAGSNMFLWFTHLNWTVTRSHHYIEALAVVSSCLKSLCCSCVFEFFFLVLVQMRHLGSQLLCLLSIMVDWGAFLPLAQKQFPGKDKINPYLFLMLSWQAFMKLCTNKIYLYISWWLFWT